jgi:hypothetical protein
MQSRLSRFSFKTLDSITSTIFFPGGKTPKIIKLGVEILSFKIGGIKSTLSQNKGGKTAFNNRNIIVIKQISVKTGTIHLSVFLFYLIVYLFYRI